MGVAGSERLLRIVVSDGRTLALDGCSRKASQLGLFFKATLRLLGLVEFLVLFAVAGVLHAEQGVQTGKQLFEQLCA